MKWSIIFAIPVLYTLFFLGCSSTTTQAGSDLSTGEKMSKDDLSHDEVSLLSSIQALEINSIEMSQSEVASDETSEDSTGDTASAVEAPAQTTPATRTSASSGAASQNSNAATSASPSTSSSTASSESSSATEPAASPSSDSGASAANSSDATLSRVIRTHLSNVGLSPAKSLGMIRRAASATSSNDAETSVDNASESSSATEVDETPAANTAVTTRPPATTREVLRAVGNLRGLSSWTVIPFAHFRRGDRHAVVAWPAINSAGELVDATVVGICLEETEDGGLEECGRRWVVREQAASRAAMVEALGGSDYQVVGRSSGMALDDIGPRLASLGTEFSNAVSNGNRSGASRAAVAATRLLPLNRVAYENGVARLLWAAARHEGRLDHVSTVRNGNSATLTFHVRRGIFRLQTITATAQPINGNTDRWIITSYR